MCCHVDVTQIESFETMHHVCNFIPSYDGILSKRYYNIMHHPILLIEIFP